MISSKQSGRSFSAIAIVAVLVFATTGQYAFADNVQNDVSSNPGSNTITIGGSTSVGYRINANNGDGQNGCNAADSSPATLTINVPAGVTRTPSSLIFTSCGVTQNVVFSSSTVGNYPITVSVVDSGAGTYNTNPATFTLNVLAPTNTAPQLTLPPGITAEATGPSGAAAVLYSVTSNDAEDNPDPTPICTPASGSAFAIGQTTVNCAVTDSGGMSATGSFEITVVDTTKPVLTVPGDITIEATSASGASAIFSASATDTVDGALIPSCSPSSGSTFPLGSSVVACSATDVHGNTETKSFTVTVQDTVAPDVVVPASQTIEATGPSGSIATYAGQSATDVVDGTLSVLCTPSSGAMFVIGTTTVTCNVTDSHGNAGSNSFTVTVQDTTAPVVTVPSNQEVEATGPSGAVVSFASASANDVVDGPIEVSCTYLSGATFPLGTTTVSCSATDAHGNTGSNTFIVTVQDTTAPVITVPTDLTAEATGSSGASVTYSGQSAMDVVDGSVSVICTPASGSIFALGTNVVSCSATDAHGNSGTSSFTVTVQDTTAPAVSVPSDLIAEATSPSGASVTYNGQSASDAVDGSVAVSCVPISGSTFPLGDTTVTCSATDAHQNTGTGTFTVTVRDTTAPTIASHADMALFTTSSSGRAVTYAVPTATDLVDGPVTVGCTPASGSTFALGTTTVNCSVTDVHGNTAASTFKVTVTKWSGILQPVNADGSSIFKLKSTVPVKLQLFQNDGVTPDSTATVKISVAKYSGNIEGTYAEALSTSAATTGNLFRYDATNNQYIFNWGTNGLSTGTWLLKVSVNGNDVITDTKPTNPTPTGYTVEVSLR